MNRVVRAVEVAGQGRLQINARTSAQPPLYLRWVLLVFTVTAVVVVGWIVSLRLISHPSELFAGYEEILPGQPWSAGSALRFYCDPHRGAGQYDYRTRGPANGTFSSVGVTLLNGIVNRVDFIVAEDRLTAGDLANLWGKPRVMIYGTSANIEWPGAGVKARGWAANGKFSYFIPVHHISLGSQPMNNSTGTCAGGQVG